MNQINLFIELTRLKKPIGYMLLFWPCSWGLTIAYDFSGEKITYIIYLILFFTGAVLMRSAGCVVNDIVDRKYDKKVLRTKNRPIASGKVSVLLGAFYSITLCLIALIVLIQFNYYTIILALGSMPLAFSYPLMKRYTYWPQLFLGITFNYGLILGWISVTNEISFIPILLYLGAIFWTIGYDTIYGFQDIYDDQIIGLKSTSIKFKKKPVKFLSACYSIFILNLLLVGYLAELNYIFYFFCSIILIQMIGYQIKRVNINMPSKCFEIFKSNNTIGLLIFLGIFVGKIQI
tara:strand:- start:925 stop:1794 length:870 start_codon:yes stop_codon:yes gene_type:complete